MDAGSRWSVEKSIDGVSLCLAHPGGGICRIELNRDEARKLIAELEEKAAG
jgi:hypothetical protein